MLTRYSVIALAALTAGIIGSPAVADDFVSDLAACAKAPIKAASFALTQSKKAAEFIVNHGECVPMVVSGDPLLYGATAGFVGLQGAGELPPGTQACIDATMGQASQQVANVLKAFVDKPPMASFIPQAGKTKLIEIAEGETNAALYQVPGIGLVMDRILCACAVTSSGVDIEELKAQIKNVVESVEGCAGLASKLLSGVYSLAKGVVGAAKDAVNSVGCTLGLGGCSDDGPPFFCTGYFKMRDGGKTREQIVAVFPSTFVSIPSQTQKCEQQYADMQMADIENAAAAKAQELGGAMALGFAFRWIPKCYDAQCKGQISKLADAYTLDIQDPETIHQYPDINQLKFVMENKYGARATLAVASSKYRRNKALMADANAPPADRLDAFGCRPFLGRARQSMCKSQDGFAVCRDYVNNGDWNVCALEGKSGLYSAGHALRTAVRAAGCIPEASQARDPAAARRSASMRVENLSAQCLSGRARVQCNAFAHGQSRVTCMGPAQLLVFDQSRLSHKLAPGLFNPIPPPPPRSSREAPPAITPRAIPSRLRTVRPRLSTICAFDAGPRAGQRQDYARMDPLPLGTPCRDGRGSTGQVVAP